MQALIIKILLRFFALMPLPLNHRCGHLLGLILYLSKGRSYRISQININTCFPELDSVAQQQLLKKSLIELGKTISEIGPMWIWSPERTLALLVKISGREHLDAARRSGKGIILLTPHLGCWEIAGLFLGAELPVTILYSQTKIKELEPIIRSARIRSGAELVAADANGVKAIFKTLRQGKATGILPDQNPDDLNSAVYAPFFKIPVATMVFISKLANKTGASILIGYARRLNNGQGYHLFINKADDEISEPDPVIAATALNKTIEKYIREVPEQYQWSYKRFKRLPAGYKKLY